MKKILMVSYVSLNIEGRLYRCYTALQSIEGILVKLIQGTTNDKEKNDDPNIINVDRGEGMKSYVRFIRKVWELISHEEYDYLYLHDYKEAILSRKCPNNKVIYDAYELLYPGSGLKFRLREWLYYFEEKRVIKKSGLVISANKERAYVMVGRYKLHYIPYVIENVPMVMNKEVKSLDKREFAVVYAGYINENNGIADLIEAVEKYNKKAERKLKVHLYGKWMLKGSVEDYEKRGAIYHGPYKLEELESILQRYVFGFLSYKNENLDTILCAPNKYYDYINNGNVAICNDNYLMMELTNRNRTGRGCEDLNVSISDSINNYLEYFANISKVRHQLNNSNQFSLLIDYILNNNTKKDMF